MSEIRHMGSAEHYYCEKIMESFVVYKSHGKHPGQPYLKYTYYIKHGHTNVAEFEVNSFEEAAEKYVQYKISAKESK